MRIVYLNMDRRDDRRAWMESQATAIGLSFERFRAVDGDDLDHNPAEDAGISAGAYACFLGHRAMWKSIAEGDEPFAVVLEDDVHLSTDAKDYLRTDAWIPADADLIHLEWERSQCMVWNHNRTKAGKRTLYRLAGECAGAAAYVISKRCAQILSAELTSLDKEFDSILFSGDYVTRLNILKLYPAIAIQDARRKRRDKFDLGSDNRSNIVHFPLEAGDEDKPNFYLAKKIISEAQRFFRKTTDRLIEMTDANVIIKKRFRYK